MPFLDGLFLGLLQNFPKQYFGEVLRKAVITSARV